MNLDGLESTRLGSRNGPKSVPRYMPTNILVILGAHVPSKMPRMNQGPGEPNGEDGPYTSEGGKYAPVLPEPHDAGNRYEMVYLPLLPHETGRTLLHLDESSI